MSKPPLITSVAIHPKTDQPIGIYETPPMPVPDGATMLEARFPRHAWSDVGGIAIHFQVWISYNGGRKYGLVVGAGTRGGDVLLRDGTISPESSIRTGIKPQYKTNARMFKLCIDCRVPLTIEPIVDFF